MRVYIRMRGCAIGRKKSEELREWRRKRGSGEKNGRRRGMERWAFAAYPRTPVGYSKCHLTISGATPKFEFKRCARDGPDRDGIRTREDLY